MILETKDIAHIAKLARLDLSAVEIAQYAKELSVVFEYVEMLNEVAVDGVAETTQVTGLTNVVRDDVGVDISKEARIALLDAFPQKNGELLTVKAVFDTE